MSLETIRDQLPDYARDLKLNLGSVLAPTGAPGLTEKQIAAVALSTAIAARNYSAVSGECLMTRRSVYDQIDGLDDGMGGLADVDYCLRVTAAGYRVVFTPHAALVQDDSWSQTMAPDAQDANRLQMRWHDRLTRDPYYNSNLSRDAPDYEPDLSAHLDGAGGTLE